MNSFRLGVTAPVVVPSAGAAPGLLHFVIYCTRYVHSVGGTIGLAPLARDNPDLRSTGILVGSSTHIAVVILGNHIHHAYYGSYIDGPVRATFGGTTTAECTRRSSHLSRDRVSRASWRFIQPGGPVAWVG